MFLKHYLQCNIFHSNIPHHLPTDLWIRSKLVDTPYLILPCSLMLPQIWISWEFSHPAFLLILHTLPRRITAFLELHYYLYPDDDPPLSLPLSLFFSPDLFPAGLHYPTAHCMSCKFKSVQLFISTSSSSVSSLVTQARCLGVILPSSLSLTPAHTQ